MEAENPRSRAGQGGWRPGRTTGAIADRVASQVSLACAPRPPGLRRGGTRNPATPAHPQRHPCRRGAGLRRPGHYPPGTAPPPDRWDVHAALEPSPAGRARATPLGVGCDPCLRHGQRRGFWDSRLEPGSPAAPARPSTAFRQVALAFLCRARRVPGSPRLAPVETPSAIHDPIALRNSGCTGRSALPSGRTTRGQWARPRWMICAPCLSRGGRRARVPRCRTGHPTPEIDGRACARAGRRARLRGWSGTWLVADARGAFEVRPAGSADGGGQLRCGAGVWPDGESQRDPQAVRADRRGVGGAAVRGGDLGGDGQAEA